MELNSTKYKNNTRTVSGTPQLFKDDVVLLCDTSTVPVTLNLLEIPDDHWNTQWKLYVVDGSGNASNNNIEIFAGAGQTINGESSYVISTDAATIIIEVSSNNTYLVTESIVLPEPFRLRVLDEGNPVVSAASELNFIGDYVVATAASGVRANITITPFDSGWVDLEGFNHIPIGSLIPKPQFRIYGKQITFRGVAIIPLASDPAGTIPVPMLGSGIGAFYVNDPYPYVYQGAGGCVLNPNGSLQINNGNSIFGGTYAGLRLDNSYAVRNFIAIRNVKVSQAQTGVQLSSVVNMSISTSGLLVIGVLKDAELNPFIPNNALGKGTSALRYLTSLVKAGQYVYDFRESANNGSAMQSSFTTPSIDVQHPLLVPDNTYLFDCDAAEETDMGGFQVPLDGLKGFLQ